MVGDGSIVEMTARLDGAFASLKDAISGLGLSSIEAASAAAPAYPVGAAAAETGIVHFDPAGQRLFARAPGHRCHKPDRQQRFGRA